MKRSIYFLRYFNVFFYVVSDGEIDIFIYISIYVINGDLKIFLNQLRLFISDFL